VGAVAPVDAAASVGDGDMETDVGNKVVPVVSAEAGAGEATGVAASVDSTAEGLASSVVADAGNNVVSVASVDASASVDAGDMEARVPLWDCHKKMKRKRNGWPKRKNLEQHLAAHPHCVVYVAQDRDTCTILSPWECLVCTYSNQAEMDMCHSCSFPRETPAAPPAPPPSTFGACAPLSTVAAESAFNSGVALRVKELLPHYPFWLKARGDGNCFYRSLYIALFDFHCRGRDGGKALQGLLASVVDIDLSQSVLLLAAQGTCANYLRSLVTDPVPLDSISWREDRISDFIKDPSLDEALVVVLRALTARQLMQDYHLDETGAMHSILSPEHSSFQDYCAKEVSSLGVCAGDLVFNSICKALGVRMRIVYVGYGEGAKQAASFDYPSEGPCQTHLLYKSGHYDVLFPASSAWASFSVANPPTTPVCPLLTIGVVTCGCGPALQVTQAYSVASSEDSFFFAVIAGIMR
jgi:ubiquitin thioesterase protein OTUB1